MVILGIILIPPTYQVTPSLLEFISQINGLKVFFESLNLADNLKLKLNRQSLLKSALFSARIEGNPLSINDFTNQSENIHKKEVLIFLGLINILIKKLP